MKVRVPNSPQKLAAKAFTLVETLVVVGILLVLGILIAGPGMKALRSKSAAAVCMSNLRQLGTVFHSFTAEHNGEFPAIAGKSTGTEDEQNGKGGQWDVQLLPYIEMPKNKSQAPLKKTIYFCPASEGHPSYDKGTDTLLSYSYNSHLGKSEKSGSLGIRLSTAANASSVMLLADSENLNAGGVSYVPKVGQGSNNTVITSSVSPVNLATRHNQYMNILFIDGHVSPRQRLNDNDKKSSPENIRWIPTGALTGFRNP